MLHLPFFICCLIGLLSLESMAQPAPAEDMDLAAPVSVPAPPQPVPVTPISLTTAGSAQPSPSQTDSVIDSNTGFAPSLGQEAQKSDRVSLSARSHFSSAHPRMGDTVQYSIEVSWEESRIPVLVLAPDSVEFTGFKCVDQSTRHEKNAVNGKIENLAVFAYALVPTQIGPAKAAALKVRYTTGISGHEEAVFAPSAHVEILPPRFGFLQARWFQVILGLFLIAGLAAMAFSVGKKWSRSKSKGKGGPNSAEDQRAILAKEVLALRSRIGNGDSRNLLNEMERLSLSHLRVTLKALESTGKFDALLDTWLAQHPDELERMADWERLRELFRQARYAGGHKEPHELQDAWRALKRCLDVTENL